MRKALGRWAARIRLREFRVGAWLLAIASVIWAPAPAIAQHVETLRNGEAEVSFRDGCVVYYDSHGKRTHSRPGCSNDQIRRADDKIADRRADRDRDDDKGAPPQVIVGRNGEGEVVFENGCVAYYDDRGRRKRSLDKCSDRNVKRADRAMEAHRREQGLEHGGSHHGSNHERPPEIKILGDGRGRVIFSDDKCTVRYDKKGRFAQAAPACSSEQRARADREMATYRREQGLSSDYAD